jgi:hypothetical protein
MNIIAQATAMRPAMPANAASSRGIGCGNARHADTNGKNHGKELCHESLPFACK